MDNQTRRILLERVKASGFPGSILDVFQNPAILDQFIAEQQQSQLQQPQNIQVVAETPEQQRQGLRPYHNNNITNVEMAFPNVEANQSINTERMKIPINVDVIKQGNLVQSFKAIPPGIANFPTGSPEGATLIESPAKGYQTGGVKKYQTGSFDADGIKLTQVNVEGEKPAWAKDRESKTPDNINWYETINFKKWGLKDYSDYSSFNSAFRNARESQEKEFVWNDKRYNTDLVPKETSDKYWDAKKFLKDYYTNEPFTPLDTSSIVLNDFYDDYSRKKYGYTWLEYFNKIKNTPQYLDPQTDEDWETYSKYRDTLDLLDKPMFYSQYSDEAKTAFKDRAKNKYIEALNDPGYYFSITSKPDSENPILGYVDSREGKNKMYVSDTGNINDFTTFIHELSHKGDSKSRIDYYSENSRIPEINVDKLNKYGIKLTQDRFNYVSDPSETEARKMSTLYFMDRVLNKDIKSGKITKNDLDELYSTYNSEGGYGQAKSIPEDIQDLLELYKWQTDDLLKYLNNDFSYIKPTTKKTGGVRKYQTAGFDVERIMADMQYPGYTAPTVDIVDYKSDKQRKKEREELERSARILPSGAINSTFGPLDAAVGVAAGIPGLLVRGLQAGVPAVANALNAPAVVGSTALPGVTAGNAIGLGMGAYGAYSLGQDVDTGYYGSDAPTSDKVIRGLETGLNLLGTPGAMEATVAGLSKAAKPIKNAYNNVATGNSFLTDLGVRAWKSSAVGLTQSASNDMFRSLANSGKLTPQERALVLEYQSNSGKFTGRGFHKVDSEKREALNNLIKKYNLNIGDDVVLTRMFGNREGALGTNLENGRLNFGDRPTSFTAGVRPSAYGSANNRLVIPRRYSKQMGENFLVNQYDQPSDETLNLLDDKAREFSLGVSSNTNLQTERELIGTGLDFKQIGKVKNDIGGYDLIVEPNNPKTPGGVRTYLKGGLKNRVLYNKARYKR